MVEFKVPRTHWTIEAHSKEGELLWTEEIDNLVTDEGVNFLLEKFFRGANYTAGWYIGLVNDGGTFSTSDIASAHAGWTENVSYSAMNRPDAVFGPIGSKATDNAGSKAVFTMTANAAIMGVFLSSVATKGATSGALYAEAAFASGPKSLAIDAVLTVTVSVSGA